MREVLQRLGEIQLPIRTAGTEPRHPRSTGAAEAQPVAATMTLDFSLFPDTCSLPENLSTDWKRADYVARVCSAWDFGITPTRETFEILGMWRDIFDRFPISGSPSYLAFRMAFGWPPADGGQIQVSRYERLDRRFRQDRDPFADCT